MSGILIGLQKPEDAKKIDRILRGRGLAPSAACTTAAQILAQANRLESGILICGKGFPDMYYNQLAEYLPDYFQMVLLTASPESEEKASNIVMLQMPFRAGELTGTVEMLLAQLHRRLKKQKADLRRSQKGKKDIDAAKKLLMDRNHMTEQEAFRYIQKCSMDSGTNMAEVAQMILLMDGER